jgi:hypothetical protein
MNRHAFFGVILLGAPLVGCSAMISEEVKGALPDAGPQQAAGDAGEMGGGGGGGNGGGGAAGGMGGSGGGGLITGGPAVGALGVFEPVLKWPVSTHPIDGEALLADPARVGDFYFFYQEATPTAHERHVLKSTDFGNTWAGVEKTVVLGNAWGNAIDPNPHRDPNTPPTMYAPAGFQNNGLWKSTDGAVTWVDLFANHHDGVMPKTGGGTVTFPADKVGGHVDFYQVHILPDDPPNHILVTYHYGAEGQPTPVGESKDGGQSWEIHLIPWGGSHYVYGLDANTWLLISGDGSNGGIYRTTTAGRVNGQISAAAWTLVDPMEHMHGAFTPWFDSANHALYFAGTRGIKRSTDGGASWTTVSANTASTLVATKDFIYAQTLYSSNIQRASRADPTQWKPFPVPNTPEWWGGVPPFAAASAFDGQHWVIVQANRGQYNNNQLPLVRNGELWRFIEP